MVDIKNKRNSGGGRICYLDGLRCFAILLVIESHVWSLGMDIPTYEKLSGLMLYTFNLPLFFFVSGYLGYKPEMTVSVICTNVKKKFILLVIPTLAFSLVSSLLYHNNWNPLYYGFGGYWFPITLFFIFIIYYITHILFSKERYRNLFVILLAVLTVILLSVYSEFGPKILDLNHFCKYFYFFVIGIIARCYNDKFSRIMNSELFKAISVVLFFVGLLAVNHQIWPSPLFHLIRDIILRVLGTGIVVCLFYSNATFFEKRLRINCIINDIGQKSLAIYLLQYFFIPDLSFFNGIITNLDEFSLHIISFTYTIIIALSCYVFIFFLGQSKIINKYVLGMR